jgi:hypothetical protein
MPIRSHLNGHTFDPETIRVMGLAYEMALIALRLTDRGDIANDVVAHNCRRVFPTCRHEPDPMGACCFSRLSNTEARDWLSPQVVRSAGL